MAPPVGEAATTVPAEIASALPSFNLVKRTALFTRKQAEVAALIMIASMQRHLNWMVADQYRRCQST